jgi:hypothetical protein
VTLFHSLEQGLNDLVERMQVDMPQFNQVVSDAYFTRRNAAERLMNAARDSSTDHTSWLSMVGNPMQMMGAAQQFDVVCWWLAYEQLAEHFEVPLSWIHTLQLQAITDPMKSTWRAKGISLMDDEGYLTESAYAAYLDGYEAGFVPLSEDAELLRNPSDAEVNETNKGVFQSLLDMSGIESSVDDALKGHDFWLA